MGESGPKQTHVLTFQSHLQPSCSLAFFISISEMKDRGKIEGWPVIENKHRVVPVPAVRHVVKVSLQDTGTILCLFSITYIFPFPVMKKAKEHGD